MKILLAVDGSPHSKRAAEFLREVAAGRRHQVTVLNVTPPVTASGEKGVKSITAVVKETAEAMTAYFEKELRRGGSFETRSAVAETRNVAGAILDRAEKERSDLVVLGARGLTPFKAFFLGSVSQNVLSHASAPVLVVRQGRKPGPLRVLAAVDGSHASLRAVRFLDRLGLPPRARVTLLHVVVDPMAGWIPGPYGMAVDGVGSLAADGKTMAALRRRGRHLLDQARKLLGRRVETVLETGFPAEVIIRAAKARSADLIVIGRRGLSRLDRFVLGSVSQKVSAYGGCSALVAR